MSLALPRPSVLVITDRRQATLPLLDLARALFAGGCRWLSLREKDLPADQRRALLRALVEAGERDGAMVMVHDDVEAAVASGAAGVHLPAAGSIIAARRALGAHRLIGYSVHSAAEIATAAEAGADYVTLSPIFPSASKPDYGPALGLDALEGSWSIPVIALGGIDARNAGTCLAAGAAGIAIMGEAMRASDPQTFMAGLLRRWPPPLAGGLQRRS